MIDPDLAEYIDRRVRDATKNLQREMDTLRADHEADTSKLEAENKDQSNKQLKLYGMVIGLSALVSGGSRLIF